MPIRISSAINGFRRAGVAHPNKPTVYPDNFFTKAQVEQLKAEPRLAVEFGDFEEKKSDQTDPSADQTGSVGPSDVSGDLTGEKSGDIEPEPETPEDSSDDLIDANIDGVVDPDGTQKSLEELTVAELRDIAKDMEIDGYTSLKKADLVEAIRATEVSVSADEA